MDKNLVIILAVVFSLLGVSLLIIAILLFRRYRQSQCPFSRLTHRGATPIDDDEIATWRGKTQPMGESGPFHHRTTSSIVFSHAPGWTWTVESSPSNTRNGDGIITYPPMIARAPNARSGLTDGVVPSEDPFVTPVKRQSSRASKSFHGRNKSRRSSISSSFKDRTGTLDNPDEEGPQKHTRGGSRGSRARSGTSPSWSTDDRPGPLSSYPTSMYGAKEKPSIEVTIVDS